MKRFPVLLQCLIIALLALSAVGPAVAKDAGFQTGHTVWRGTNAFTGWTLSGLTKAKDGTLLLSSAAAPGTDPYGPGGYNGGNYYNGGSFLVGEAAGPVVMPGFPFQEAIASWNADTPAGTWIETQVSAGYPDGRWSKWYSLGVWTSQNSGNVLRHSVNLQGDADGYVAVDTLVLAKSKVQADKLKLKMLLFSENSAVPVLRSMSLTYSSSAPKSFVPSTGDSANWNTLLAVPECSQMVYPDGGNVWCSPTSVSMVLGYYGFMPGPCEPRVRATVAGVYDWMYDGHGNWPFNTAFAASVDVSPRLEGYVMRYTSLDQLEPWVKAGVPVVMSIAWGKKDLTNAPIPSSSGHLVALVGFDQAGNPIVNDPAASTNEDVQRTYLRGELEQVWLTNSAGTVYLIFPPDKAVGF